MRYRPVGVVLIGLGEFGRGMARVMQKSRKIKLLAGFHSDFKVDADFSKEFNCPIKEGDEEILKNEKVEAVVITSANYNHCAQTLLAARYKKHVFCDKPIANTVKEAKKMIKACQKNKVILGIGHQSRRLSLIRKMKSLVEKGVLGKVIMVEASSSGNGLPWKPGQWRWDRKKCPALPLMQLGVHECDTFNYLFGPVKSVIALHKKVYPTVPNIDTTVTILEFEQGALGYLGSSYVTSGINYIHVCGVKANLFCNLNTQKLYISQKEIPLKKVDALKEELEEFADCIRKNKKPEVGGKEALDALAIVEASIKSAKMHRPISIREIMK